jgi:hypothetical protein
MKVVLMALLATSLATGLVGQASAATRPAKHKSPAADRATAHRTTVDPDKGFNNYYGARFGSREWWDLQQDKELW